MPLRRESQKSNQSSREQLMSVKTEERERGSERHVSDIVQLFMNSLRVSSCLSILLCCRCCSIDERESRFEGSRWKKILIHNRDCFTLLTINYRSMVKQSSTNNIHFYYAFHSNIVARVVHVDRVLIGITWFGLGINHRNAQHTTRQN